MARTVGIGYQDFGDLRRANCFYIDKTGFIKEWWENKDVVTLIARPRRFGKTLTMSMMEYFWSVKYENCGEIFEKLVIWEEKEYRELQGTYPVINLSFANVKGNKYETVRGNLCQVLVNLYSDYEFVFQANSLTEADKEFYQRVSLDMDDTTLVFALHQLSKCLYQYYGKKVILLLDEYDTPMQEAYVYGYWDELIALMRVMFNSAFKTNPYMERALLTGITRISRESIFSDLNNLEVVTITSNKYVDSFGFTEQEVFAAMDEFGLKNYAEVKAWYDGFIFGDTKEIYNPWSIVNYLSKGKLSAYWANSSSNGLVSKLICEGSNTIKEDLGVLLRGASIKSEIDEEIVYNHLDNDESVWSLLLASGYLKVLQICGSEYELSLTNHEVENMFEKMVKGWFKKGNSNYNDFLKALLLDDLKAMNAYMNQVALSSFSYFDTGKNASELEPERFYHGFVLGLLVEFSDRYLIHSNRESGFGRYDILLEPQNSTDDGIIIEFKVQETEEKSLQDTVDAALQQIEEKMYEQELVKRGISRERIRKYGFAFQGKRVLIGKS